MSKESIRVSQYELAVSYRQSADLLVEHIASWKKGGHGIFPAMFLYSHAVELFLKEYLRLAGYEEARLKQFGHRLRKLWTAARKEGIVLEMPHAMDQLIPSLEAGHENYQFRYSEKSFNFYGPNWMQRDVAKLADAVAAKVQESRSIGACGNDGDTGNLRFDRYRRATDSG
jgi:HEPN domain-containing protein